ncbi:MAG: DUF732 domain-containing protein [Mycobacterium sp.]
MKLLLAAASFAAIIGIAVPAHADSTDDGFIASLQSAGITYSDPDKAIDAGKWVCDTVVNHGMPMPDVVHIIESTNSALSEEKANKFAAIAASAYCPDTVSTTTVTADSTS